MRLTLAAFLRFAALATLATGLASTACVTTQKCDVACFYEPQVLTASKPVATVTSSDTNVCDATPMCDDAGADCASVRVSVLGPGLCKLSVTYADGTTSTLSALATGDSSACCAGYSISAKSIP
jgi:hypothetical protein